MPPKKKPFSNKQKKAQLQQKRQRKKEKVPFGSSPPKPRSKLSPLPQSASDSQSEEESEVRVALKPRAELPKVHPQTIRALIKHHDPNRYRFRFHQESKDEIERKKLEAKTIPIERLCEEEALEVGIEDVYHPGSVLDIPKRPPWDYSMTKSQVEKHEEEHFSKYVQRIYQQYSPQDLSYFELNIETWRQLWRVLEISDLVLMITDVRHPALHFSPALYNYVVKELKKDMILVLNKVDIVPPQVAVAWKHYFARKFPDLAVVCFTSFPNEELSLEPSNKVKFKLRKKGSKLLTAVGPRELFCIVESLYRQKNIDMLSWQQKLDSATIGAGGVCESDDMKELDKSLCSDTGIEHDDKVVTIGLLGHPNVGKSSILNGLMAKKMVSISRTPGHTKHFQTIFLTPSIRLCDCPGLVFPSLVNKQLQILSGLYPISQVREPYTSVGYLAQRLPLVQMLSLIHLDHYDRSDYLPSTGGGATSITGGKDQVWTPWDICDAWAYKRGYMTKRGAKLDTYRAANDLLRLAADGRICLYFRPPGFTKEKAYWDSHPDVEDMIKLQREGMGTKDDQEDEEEEEEESSNETEEGSSTDSDHPVLEQNKFSALTNLQDSSDD